MKLTWVIGTRGSPLARAQAGWVARRLREQWPDARCEIRTFQTVGDREGERALPEIGGKGLFTQELEAALLDGSIDVAVHSLKDLPTALAAGLALGAVPERDDPRDVWCVRDPGAPRHPRAAEPGWRVGTSSLRRQAQCLECQPRAIVERIRGNVGTRLAKLERGDFDAIILAAAGLRRLNAVSGASFHPLEPPDWLPAPGQGALAIECRADDEQTLAALAEIEDGAARAETDAERALLAALQGGCQVPLGALARGQGGRLELWAFLGTPDGQRVARGHVSGPDADPDALGRGLAEELRRRGAEEILSVIRSSPHG